MTNREKLIELLAEKDGKVDIKAIDELIDCSPFRKRCSVYFNCDGDIKCSVCASQWLNKEAKE